MVRRSILMLVAIVPLLTNNVWGAELWFGGIAPSIYSKKFGGGPYDFLQMFQPGAPWSKGASGLQVFQTTAPLILDESDETLRSIFAFLKSHNIELAVEMGLLAGDDASGNKVCGLHIEGYAAPRTAQRVAMRIQQNGGDLRYIAMDEPLFYGHQFTGPNSCQWSPEQVARDILPRAQAVKQIFPNVMIGDDEPVAQKNASNWNDQIIEWTHTYQKVVGQPLAFIRADVQWKNPWQSDLANLKSRLHQEGIKMAINFNGGGEPGDQSDEGWAQTAINRCRTIEANPRLSPDMATVQSWVRWPSHLLPESQPGTLTNVLMQCEQYAH
jgi:hypothetical protein